MPNAIKYNVSAETLALKKGNFWIGTGDVSKGPTSSTGYYNGITPPSGGYTIYLNKESGGPSIYTTTSDAQLISLTNTIAGANYTTVSQCLVYYAGQTDKIIFNRDYPAIVTNGLILNLDAGFTPSYPTTNTTWYNVSPSGGNGVLINGPTFNSSNGGTIITDAVDDTIQVNYNFAQHSTITINFFANSSYINESMIWSMGGNGPDWYIKENTMGYNSYGGDTYGLSTTQINNLGLRNNWRLITMTYTQNSPVSNNKVYVNGVEQSTSQQLGTTNGMSFNNQIYFTSAYGNGAGYCLSATVGYISIYNRALSASEVLQNYNALKGRYGL
jgi:hypothetical protein